MVSIVQNILVPYVPNRFFPFIFLNINPFMDLQILYENPMRMTNERDPIEG